MTGKILENAMIADIVRGLPRRRAIDAPADAELIAFDARGETLIAISSDSLSEEIATGLYDDPVTIGWVLVMSTASDLAAVGARLLWGWTVPGWGWIAWLAALCVAQIAFRWRIERRDGRSGAIAWAHPIANVVLIAILLRSVFGVRASWKGRSFVDGRAAD